MSKAEVFGAVVLILIVESVYFKCLYPHIAPGDSPELVAAAHGLGIGHPPGYPLFLVINKAWSSIFPLGSIGYRANLLNSLISVAAILTIYYISLSISASPPLSVALGLAFAFNTIVWE
jgi:hypothetical protein